jgi:hypothetical protein
LLLTELKYNYKILHSELIEILVNSLVYPLRLSDYKPRVIVPNRRVIAGDTFYVELFIEEDLSHGPFDIVINKKPERIDLPYFYKEVAPNENQKHTLKGHFILDGIEGAKELPFSEEWESFKPSAIISNEMYPVLYIGIENIVNIHVPDIPDDDFRVSIDKGSILKSSKKGQYVCKVNYSDTMTAKIKVEYKNKNGVFETLATHEYKVREIEFELLFGNLPSGKYSKKALLNQKNLNLKFTVNIVLEGVKIEVKKYKVDLVSKNKEITSFEIDGNSLDKVHELIKNAENGDELRISEVITRFPHNKTEKVSQSLKIVILD